MYLSAKGTTQGNQKENENMTISIIENNGETIFFTDSNDSGVSYAVPVNLDADSITEYDADYNASAMNCVGPESVSFRENLISELREAMAK